MVIRSGFPSHPLSIGHSPLILPRDSLGNEAREVTESKGLLSYHRPTRSGAISRTNRVTFAKRCCGLFPPDVARSSRKSREKLGWLCSPAFRTHSEPLKSSRKVASIEAAAAAASDAYRKSLYKLDIPTGIVPTSIVTILRHARDVLPVSFHSDQLLGSRAPPTPRAHENPAEGSVPRLKSRQTVPRTCVTGGQESVIFISSNQVRQGDTGWQLAAVSARGNVSKNPLVPNQIQLYCNLELQEDGRSDKVAVGSVIRYAKPYTIKAKNEQEMVSIHRVHATLCATQEGLELNRFGNPAPKS